MKKYRNMILCMMLVLLAAMPMGAQATSKKAKALAAYNTFLAQTTGKYGKEYDKFAIAYINNDSVPELVFRDPVYTYFYTYKSGKVTLLHKDLSMNVFKYYKKKGMLVRLYVHRGLQTTTYMRLSKGTFKEYLGTQKYNGETNYFKYVREKSYYTEKLTTKSKFNKLLKKYVGSKKATAFKFYKNTAANRKKRLK